MYNGLGDCCKRSSCDCAILSLVYWFCCAISNSYSNFLVKEESYDGFA